MPPSLIESLAPSALKTWVSTTGEALLNNRFEGLYTMSSRGDSPDWIQGLSDVEYIRNRHGKCSTYALSFQETIDDGAVTISPPNIFQTVEFDLVGVEPSMDFTVSVEFETPDSEIIEQKRQFVNGRYNTQRIIPVHFKVDSPAMRAKISTDISNNGRPNEDRTAASRLLSRFKGGEVWSPRDRKSASLSLPRAGTPDKGTPIFFISIDTLRYDFLDRLSPLIKALGESAVVPDEPRTQGSSTWPSHASMLTGVHPGRHGCHAGVETPEIDPSLRTLPSILAEEGYKCSGLVSCGNLLPERGFARGFHRYEYQPMSWRERDVDARTNVNTVIDWLSTDLELSNRQFYFLHLFDAHYPYLPPFPLSDGDINVRAVERYLDQSGEYDYVELVRDDPLDIGPEDLRSIKEWYGKSLEFVGHQLRRLVESIKQKGIFEDSFIIVTGDHGEDFYERNFILHRSLYDTNIRPGMIVKPPRDVEFEVPETPDTIDFAPTIGDLVKSTAANAFDGLSWFKQEEERPLITEQFSDWYSISVQSGGSKGIFTRGERNSDSQVHDASPWELEEFYDVELVRSGQIDEASSAVGTEKRQRLRNLRDSFLDVRKQIQASTDGRELPSNVASNLEQLGYK